jgi:hypothetical protein
MKKPPPINPWIVANDVYIVLKKPTEGGMRAAKPYTRVAKTGINSRGKVWEKCSLLSKNINTPSSSRCKRLIPNGNRTRPIRVINFNIASGTTGKTW